MEIEKKEVQETAAPEGASAPEQSGDNTQTTAEVVDTQVRGKTRLVAGVVFVALLILGAVYYVSQNKSDTDDLSALSAGDPTTVRAVVNGEEITQAVITDRLSELQGALNAQGIDLTNAETRAQIESQILNDTINYTLLKQAAKEAGTTVSDESVETAYNEYVTQMGGEEALTAQLQTINLTPEEFKVRVKEQLTLDAFINDNVDVSDVTVTDEEITAFYDNAVSTFGDGAPALEEVRTQIEEQLLTQKRQELTQAFIDSLREGASITIN